MEELIIDGGTAEGVDYSLMEVTLAQTEKDYIINTILTTLDNSIGVDISLIKGLVQHNYRLNNMSYDSSGNLISGTIKIYETASDCNAQTNEIAQYNIVANYNAQGLLLDYKVIE